MLDSLCSTSLLAKSHPGTSSQASSSFDVDYVARDLNMLVDLVVPEGARGPDEHKAGTSYYPCLSAHTHPSPEFRQILESWRSQRVIDT